MSSPGTGIKRKRKASKPRKGGERKAIITAPSATDTSVIRQILEKHGVKAFAADELGLAGFPLSKVVTEAIGRADIVVAILGGKDESGNVLFEVGIAQGLGKPTLVIAAKQEATFLAAQAGIPYLRAKPDNFAALEFGLAQFLAAPHRADSGLKTAERETRPLGSHADLLLANLHASREEGHLQEYRLEEIIVEALRKSGIATISRGEKRGDKEIDIAVWSNDFEPWIGNPLLIEIKNHLPRKGELDNMAKRFANAMGPESVNWALVIYGEAAPQTRRIKRLYSHILFLSAEDLLEGLRDNAFGDLVRQLRNERVHGRG
jgi:hypothetical protein